MKLIQYPENRKADNPNKDVLFIYESGGRDIENPFGDEALDDLADETEGSWQVDLRNVSSRKDAGYPKDEEENFKGTDYIKDEQEYPFYYSKKGAPRGHGYPSEKDWWQKALSSAKSADVMYLLKPSAEELLNCVLRFKTGDRRKSQLWSLIIQDDELTQQLAARLRNR